MSDVNPETRQAVAPVAGDRLVQIAQQILNYFEAISTQARAQLAGERGPSTSSLAVVNTLTADRAVQNLRVISEDRLRDLRQLCIEPAIARVVVLGEDNQEKTIFITRASPLSGGGALAASYRSPMGRLAAIPVGQDHDVKTPVGVRNYEVQERAELKPAQKTDGWDSINTVVQGRDYGPLTIVSLRALLRSRGVQEDEIDLLEKLLEQDRSASNVIEGLRRTVIEKMGLRDQPLLDQYQDEIFRLPLDSRLVILGPPGSGKTTTLIKRLGLKLDREHLEDDERILVERSVAGLNGLPTSWLMFTPTELLKQYVKEAFARENIAASDLRIQTWSDYRRELARNRLGVLRTSSGTGYVLKDGLQSLNHETMDRQIKWFDDFERWQASQFWSELELQAKRLSANPEPSTAVLGSRLMAILNSAAGANPGTSFISINQLGHETSALIAKLRADIDGRLRRAFAQELKRDNRLLDDLLNFLNTLGDSADPSEDVEDPDADDDEEEEPASHRGDREEAFEAYRRAGRAQARAAVAGRSVRRGSCVTSIVMSTGDAQLYER